MKKFISVAAFVAAILGIAAPVQALDWPGFQQWPSAEKRYYWESADTHHGRFSPPTKQAYTLVLGDSIAKYTQYKLNVLHPDWVQDNKDARSVDEVFSLIHYWTWRKHRAPARLVMALGSVPGSWGAADFLKVHEALPDTKILFVTLYRSTEPTPDWPHPPASPELGAKMEELSNGMKQAAQVQPRVCVADWRTLVQIKAATLFDGVHPDTPSLSVWAHLVSTSMRTCPRPAPDPTPPTPTPTP